jgi:hypothetical protein
MCFGAVFCDRVSHGTDGTHFVGVLVIDTDDQLRQVLGAGYCDLSRQKHSVYLLHTKNQKPSHDGRHL